jgi:hypothetical protein
MAAMRGQTCVNQKRSSEDRSASYRDHIRCRLNEAATSSDRVRQSQMRLGGGDRESELVGCLTSTSMSERRTSVIGRGGRI